MTTLAYPQDLQSLIATLPGLDGNDHALVSKAYHLAEVAHKGQVRKSGKPFFTHSVAVASILAEMRMDAETIAAGLLHDVVEDTPTTIEAIESEFGETIAKLVDGVTKLRHLPIKKKESEGSAKRSSVVSRSLESVRKMLLTLDDDVRVVLIKLADRLHNMQTLAFMPEEKRKRIAQETLDIYAPLANRLGIWQIKWELEDLSFRYLDSDAYNLIAKSLDERRADREAYLIQIIDRLRDELNQADLPNAIITGRPKHIYSIYRKMRRKSANLHEIYDMRAVRVIVDTVPQCYLVLGLVHSIWRPIPGEFDDYIAAPKDNFYRSLHTAVVDDAGKIVEVQIRTLEMHEDSEYGIAAHWRYKEGAQRANDKAFEDRVRYLRRLMEFRSEVESDDAETFIDTMKQEVFEDRVYTFTPNGDVVDLPRGSTPIDFAYYIHTEIGHRCRGAKVQGNIVPLSYELQMGDQVEIQTAKRGGPSLDWLNSDLGYAKTSRAKSKIRHWFRKQDRDKHIALGRETLERELRRLGVLDRMSFEHVAGLFSIPKLDEFLASIGSGDITGGQIANHVLEEERRNNKIKEVEKMLLAPNMRPNHVNTVTGVSIAGTGGLLTNLARCCNPMPGEKIIGFITRGRGVTVHRQDCSNITSLVDVERLIDVSWEQASDEQRYAVPIEIVAYDREGLLQEVSTVISDEKVNISSVEVKTRQQIASLYLTLEINSNPQLSRILAKLDCIRDVVEARRRNMS